MADNTHDPEADDTSTLLEVNDNPPDPKNAKKAAGEKEDDVTVLARVNDNPPRDSSDE